MSDFEWRVDGLDASGIRTSNIGIGDTPGQAYRLLGQLARVMPDGIDLSLWVDGRYQHIWCGSIEDFVEGFFGECWRRGVTGMKLWPEDLQSTTPQAREE